MPTFELDNGLGGPAGIQRGDLVVREKRTCSLGVDDGCAHNNDDVEY
jgi:hypothetical protein